MATEPLDLHGMFQYVLLEIHAAWRYRWRALIVAWCVVIVGALLVFSLPNKYESSAQVYADTDALTNPLLKGIAVQPDVQQRLEIITRTLLARPNLETVADKTGLSLRATTPADKDKLLAKLGAAVTVKDAGVKNLYNISYKDSDRQMSQKVVQAFLQILMNDTLGANTASNASAQSFLQQQVDDYGRRLNESERKLAEFQKANIAYLPGPGAGAGDFSTRLQAAESKLQDLQIMYDAAAIGGTPAQRVNSQVQDIDKQLAAARQRLQTLLLTYTNEYPDVITARRMIKELEARREKVLKHPDRAAVAAAPAPAAQGDGTAQLNARLLAAQVAAQKQQVADLKKNADKITDTAVTLKQLTRNYEINKKQYDELVTRLNAAQLSQDATQTGNNLKFRVISPPILPLAPVSPHRGLLLLVVLVLALGIGGAYAYFLHKIKPAFTSLKSLREFVDYPVIGSFSLIESSGHRAGQRRELVRFCAGTCLLAVIIVLGITFSGPLAGVMQHVFVMGAT